MLSGNSCQLLSTLWWWPLVLIKENEYSSAAFLDVSQVFDRFWPQGFVFKTTKMLPGKFCQLPEFHMQKLTLRSIRYSVYHRGMFLDLCIFVQHCPYLLNTKNITWQLMVIKANKYSSVEFLYFSQVFDECCQQCFICKMTITLPGNFCQKHTPHRTEKIFQIQLGYHMGVFLNLSGFALYCRYRQKQYITWYFRW